MRAYVSVLPESISDGIGSKLNLIIFAETESALDYTLMNPFKPPRRHMHECGDAHTHPFSTYISDAHQQSKRIPFPSQMTCTRAVRGRCVHRAHLLAYGDVTVTRCWQMLELPPPLSLTARKYRASEFCVR